MCLLKNISISANDKIIIFININISKWVPSIYAHTLTDTIKLSLCAKQRWHHSIYKRRHDDFYAIFSIFCSFWFVFCIFMTVKCAIIIRCYNIISTHRQSSIIFCSVFLATITQNSPLKFFVSSGRKIIKQKEQRTEKKFYERI